jgi:hypothetical protein
MNAYDTFQVHQLFAFQLKVILFYNFANTNATSHLKQQAHIIPVNFSRTWKIRSLAKGETAADRVIQFKEK